jgi:plastocyanin
MARRSSSLGGLRPLALAVVTTSLLAPVGISAQAAEEDIPPEAASTSDPVVPTPVPDPGGTAPNPGAVVSQPPAPSTVASPPPTVVTVSRAGASASKSVSIVDFAFNPGSITVNTGDTVQWTNNGKVPEGHDVTGDGLDSGLLKAGGTYSHTFSDSGSFSYICSIHPNMKGTVKVLGRSSGGSGGGSGSGESGGSSGSDAIAAGSESAAVGSLGAAGTAGSLPASGADPLPLATLGIWLLVLGLGTRVFAPALLRPRR